MGPKGFFSVLKAAFTRWGEENGAGLGAAVAYYTAFSIAPLLLLAIAIAGLVFGREAAQGHIIEQLSMLMGTRSASMIQDMIRGADAPAAGSAAALISVASLLLGASGVTSEMTQGINRMWKVPSRSGVKGFLGKRMRAVGMVLAVGFLMLVSLALSAATAAAGEMIGNWLSVPKPLLHATDLLLSFSVVIMLFAVLFKVLPNARIFWHDVWIGSAVTTVLFVLGKYALGVYLGKGAVGSSYGAAGSVLIVLAWVYYSAQILYIGAAFTSIYAERYGSGVRVRAT